MPAYPSITLRYFHCRGRAQYLRAFLRLRNIAFTDERVPMSPGWPEWQALKPDRSKSGPFQKLPVLHWGEQLIAEGSVIHDWLQRKTGDAERLPEKEQLQHAMLVSSCSSDLMLPTAMLLYVDLTHPESNLATQAANTLQRVRTHLQTMDQVLADWNWWTTLTQRGTMLADCMLWDALNFAELLFGEALQLQQFPELHRFYRQCPGNELFRALLAEHSCPITGHPSEAEAVARIRLALNTAAVPA